MGTFLCRCFQCSWCDDCFRYGYLRIFSKGMLAIIPVISVWLVLQCLESVQVVKQGLLLCSVAVAVHLTRSKLYSSVIGAEALSVRLCCP